MKQESLCEIPCRGRGRPKAVPDEAQRALIVAGARALFLEKGYGCTTTEGIAARCHISKQTLYRLFPDKAAIFAAVIDGHSRTLFDLPCNFDNLPLDEALERMFKVSLSAEEEHERVALLRLIVAEFGAVSRARRHCKAQWLRKTAPGSHRLAGPSTRARPHCHG